MAVVISRKYEVLGQLGQGGMGVVYKVRHTALDTILALKVLPRDLTENPEMITRFYREARVMARLSHPNIVRVLDIDRDESLDFHYFVMEYLQGKTLSQYLREKGPLPLSEVLVISGQVASALAYAHNHKPSVIHRDIKPANIMIEDGTGRVVVMDFGIAKELGDNEMTRAGVMVGTLKYCSPEQIRHEALDGSADVYSLGMVTYEAYTGTQFFAGLDESGVIGKVLYEPQENEPQFTRPAPTAFVTLVSKAIAKSRERRYKRAEEFLQDVEACRATVSDNGPLVVPVTGRDDTQIRNEPSEIEDLEARIKQLEEEKQKRLVTTLREQVQEAREKAAAEGAGQWAAAAFQQALALEERGGEQLRSGDYVLARETYQEAIPAFARVGEEAVTVALLRTAEEARQEMDAAKTEAERYGARDKARTFYGRALALQTQADELWDHKTYQQAGQLYGEARKVFADACDLAYQQTLKEEAEEVRHQAFTTRQAAVIAGATTLAATLFREAEENDRRAGTAMDRAEFTQARELYGLVRQQYERAAREAEHVREQAASEPTIVGGRPLERTPQETFTLQPDTGDLTRWEQPPAIPAAEPTRWEKPPVGPLSDNTRASLEGGPTIQAPASAPHTEADEDRWEIGEKSHVPPAVDLRPPTAENPSRMKPALIGIVVVGVLAILAWFAGPLLRRPSTPLTLVRTEPQAETVQMVEGKALAFTAEANGEGPLRYEWTLEGRPVSQEKEWSYKPATGESSDTPKAIKLRISDQAGQQIEKHWQVAVAHANRPPQIVTMAPSGETLELAAGAAQEFQVEATDPDNDPLTYEWTVDGVAAGTQPTLTWKAPGEGRHQIRATVRDRDLTVTREWQVAALKPLPEKPAAPKNSPPHIAQRAPEEGSLTVQKGVTQDFSVTASDPENDELTYTWSLDGKKVGKDPHFTFTAADAGKHHVDLEVADRGGLKDRVRWEVDVPAPPAAPRLIMFTPHQAELSLLPHQSRFFGVDIEVPGLVEPELSYQWKIDGRPASGQEVIEFKNKPVGTHKIEVTVTAASSGLNVTHQWTVTVRKEEGEDLNPPTLAPVLQVFDLDNSTSKDKKTITISGKVRNLDDKSAENVLVTISAVGADGQPVVRRVVLPTPQPLPGGEIATFQFAIANRETISDFRVEVVSK
ncbi:MAG: protein kinase [Deltaproteobacteria bacterium]|nr:protein kinase [Deltaproteobacteria bacterium]